MNIDENTQVVMNKGQVLIHTYFQNYGDTGAYLNRVQVDLWIEYNGRVWSYTGWNFYPENLYIPAGQKVWHTLSIADDSCPQVGGVSYRIQATTW